MTLCHVAPPVGWQNFLGSQESLKTLLPTETPLCPPDSPALRLHRKAGQIFLAAQNLKRLVCQKSPHSKSSNSHVNSLTDIMGKIGNRLKMEAYKKSKQLEEDSASTRSRSSDREKKSTKNQRKRSISRLAREKHLLMEKQQQQQQRSPSSSNSPSAGQHSPLTPRPLRTEPLTIMQSPSRTNSIAEASTKLQESSLSPQHDDVIMQVSSGNKRSLSDVEEDGFEVVLPKNKKKPPTTGNPPPSTPASGSAALAKTPVRNYAKTASKNLPRSKPPPEGPQGDLELRVYRTHHAKTTMSQQQWLTTQTLISNVLVTCLQSAEPHEIPLLVCLHSKWCLTESCGILKLGSANAKAWFKNMINTQISSASLPIRAWGSEEKVEKEVMDLLFHKSLNHMDIADLWNTSLLYHPALKAMKHEIVFTKTQDTGYRLMRLKIGPDFKEYITKRGYLIAGIMSTIKCFLVPNAPITPPPKNSTPDIYDVIDISEVKTTANPQGKITQTGNSSESTSRTAQFIAKNPRSDHPNNDVTESKAPATHADSNGPPKIVRHISSVQGVTLLQNFTPSATATLPHPVATPTLSPSIRQQQLQQLLDQQSAQRAEFEQAHDNADSPTANKTALAEAAQMEAALMEAAKSEMAKAACQLKEKQKVARENAEANRRERIALLTKQKQDMEEEMKNLEADTLAESTL